MYKVTLGAVVFTLAATFGSFVYGQVVNIESGQQSLGSALNSKVFEENAVLAPDGKSIFFSRSGHVNNAGGTNDKGDIWKAELLGDGNWGTAQNLGTPVNTQGRNTVIGFLSGNETMLLAHQTKSTDQGFSISKRSGDKWQSPRDIDIPYFKSQSEYQSASISYDGQVIIFSLMSFGTYGVEDLYLTRLKEDGSWSDLRNLGPTINTRYQEMTPFIAPDNETIYFASNGHTGEGSLDIFWSKRLDDTWRNWTEPVNLGPMVNTSGSESSFKFLPNSNWAVLVSTQNSDGYGDLKKVDISFPDDVEIKSDSLKEHPLLVEVPETDSVMTAPEIAEEEIASLFTGRVVNSKNRQPIEAKLTLTREDDSTLEVQANTNGFKSNPEPGQYNLRVTSPDFLEYDTTVVISNDAPIAQDFALFPLEVGSTITLNHVLFERGTTNLLDGSEQDLEAVYHMLRDNPSVTIEVAGHTDNQGNFKLNVKLSQDRVDAVVAYLVDKGIRKRRISGKGWGPMKPIASNNSEETRALNRRVEFTILSK